MEQKKPRAAPRMIGNGILMIPYGETEERFDSVYEGFYPPCCFSALAGIGETWYAAGNDGAGMPHLFSSESGSVWTERSIEPSFGRLRSKDYGKIEAVYPGILTDELLLIGSGGVAVSVPDCPHCVEAVRFSDEPVTEVHREGDRIRWRTAGGAEKSAALTDLIRHRVPWEWVVKHRAAVLCLYASAETEPPRIPRAIPVPENAFDRLIRELPREAYIAVTHTDPGKADSAAGLARKAGLTNCRSMGGIREALLTETTEQ